MDNMLETIYKYVYIGSYIVITVFMLIFNINAGAFSIWGTLLVFGIVTFILFLMGRLVQERFDNTLQMYLIIISILYLVSAFIKKDTGILDDMGDPVGFHYGWANFWSAISAMVIFAAAFFLDGIFESE
jgi:MFS superfamily sulfate permease-like transporter